MPGQAPNEAQVNLLLQSPEEIGPAFDEKFGEGMSQKVVDEYHKTRSASEADDIQDPVLARLAFGAGSEAERAAKIKEHSITIGDESDHPSFVQNYLVRGALGGVINSSNATIDLIQDTLGGDSTQRNRIVTKPPVGLGAGLTQGVTQFAHSFLGLGKLDALFGLKLGLQGGKAARFVSSAVRGGIADFAGFQGSDHNIFDLAKQFGADDALTDYLSTDLSDTDFEGRVKNSVAGLAAGTAIEGTVSLFTAAAKYVKATRSGNKEQILAAEKAFEDVRARETAAQPHAAEGTIDRNPQPAGPQNAAPDAIEPAPTGTPLEGNTSPDPVPASELVDTVKADGPAKAAAPEPTPAPAAAQAPPVAPPADPLKGPRSGLPFEGLDESLKQKGFTPDNAQRLADSIAQGKPGGTDLFNAKYITGEDVLRSLDSFNEGAAKTFESLKGSGWDFNRVYALAKQEADTVGVPPGDYLRAASATAKDSKDLVVSVLRDRMVTSLLAKRLHGLTQDLLAGKSAEYGGDEALHKLIVSAGDDLHNVALAARVAQSGQGAGLATNALDVGPSPSQAALDGLRRATDEKSASRIRKAAKVKRDKQGLDAEGFDPEGFDVEGFDRAGKDITGKVRPAAAPDAPAETPRQRADNLTPEERSARIVANKKARVEYLKKLTPAERKAEAAARRTRNERPITDEEKALDAKLRAFRLSYALRNTDGDPTKVYKSLRRISSTASKLGKLHNDVFRAAIFSSTQTPVIQLTYGAGRMVYDPFVDATAGLFRKDPELIRQAWDHWVGLTRSFTGVADIAKSAAQVLKDRDVAALGGTSPAARVYRVLAKGENLLDPHETYAESLDPITGDAVEHAKFLGKDALFDVTGEKISTDFRNGDLLGALNKSIGVLLNTVDYGANRVSHLMTGVPDELIKSAAASSHLYAAGMREFRAGIKAGIYKPEQKDVFLSEYVEKAFDPKTGALIDPEALSYTRDVSGTQPLQPGTVLNSVNRIRNEFPFLGQLLTPVFRAPINAFLFGAEHTPGLSFISKQWRDDLAAGGERRAKVLAKQTIGTAIYTLSIPYVLSGQLNGAGPRDPDERRAWLVDHRPNTWVHTDEDGKRHFIDLTRGDPFTTLSLMAASIIESGKGQFNEQEYTAALGNGIVAAMSQVTQRSALQSLFQSLGALSSFDEDKLSKWWKARASGYAPNILNQFNDDPYQREALDGWEAFLRKIPGQSQSLDPVRDGVFYDPLFKPQSIIPGTGWKEYIDDNSPTRSVLGTVFEAVGKRPPEPASKINGVDLKTIKMPNGFSAYDRYKELIRQVDSDSPTLRQDLEELVRDEDFKALDIGSPDAPGGKVYEIMKVYQRHFELAQRQLQDELGDTLRDAKDVLREGRYKESPSNARAIDAILGRKSAGQ